MNVDPLPTELSTATLPRIVSTMCLTIDRPRPGPTELARSARVDAIEALEDPRQVLGGDAGAGVGDHEPDARVVGRGAHDDARPRRAILDGVVDQVRQDVLEGPRGPPRRRGASAASSAPRRTPFFSARSRKSASTMGTTRWSSTRSRFSLNSFDSSFESSSMSSTRLWRRMRVALDDVEEAVRGHRVPEGARSATSRSPSGRRRSACEARATRWPRSRGGATRDGAARSRRRRRAAAPGRRPRAERPARAGGGA